MAAKEKLYQCKTCPWKVGAVPEEEIPGYSRSLHLGLQNTIKEGSASFVEPPRTMACHYSVEGKEIHCAGWLEHQRGVGNNLRVRLAMLCGDMPIPVVDGPQHETFEDTLVGSLEAEKV